MYYDYNYDNKHRFPITATFIRGRNTKASKQLFQEWYESIGKQIPLFWNAFSTTNSSLLAGVYGEDRLIN